MMKKIIIMMLISMSLSISCNGEVKESGNGKSGTSVQEEKGKGYVNPEGMTIETRYGVPSGYERVQVEAGSFEDFLRKQKLKPYGEKALYFDGREKRSEGIYDSVIDVQIGDRDLHQCADAIMLLRAEYFYQKKEYLLYHSISPLV